MKLQQIPGILLIICVPDDLGQILTPHFVMRQFSLGAIRAWVLDRAAIKVVLVAIDDTNPDDFNDFNLSPSAISFAINW